MSRRRGIHPPVDSVLQAGISKTLEMSASIAGQGRVEFIEVDLVDLFAGNPRFENRITPEEIRAHKSGEINLEGGERKDFFEGVKNLASSIKAQGLIQPIVVEQHGDRYQLVAGERRLLAHILLGSPSVRAIVRPASTEQDRFLAALVENDLREDLSFGEYVTALRKIIHSYRDSVGSDPTLDQLTGKVHRSTALLSTYRRMAADDELYQKVVSGKITSFRQARDLLTKQSTAPEPPPERKAGAPKRYASLGKIKDGRAVAFIGERLFGSEWSQMTQEVNWSDLSQVEQAWERILERVTHELKS